MSIDIEDTSLSLSAGMVAHVQGTWSEEQYLKITDYSNRLIEFTDGEIKVLPIPTDFHQAISLFLLRILLILVEPKGKVRYAPLRMQIRNGKYREPDIMVLLDGNDVRWQDNYWLGADLVIEIVSPDNPERDTVTKRADYAEAAIPEYWIVNPLDETITVLTYAEGSYREHGIFKQGDTATSLLLAGFNVVVSEVFAAE
jgi:Uma2 family endonuclease